MTEDAHISEVGDARRRAVWPPYVPVDGVAGFVILVVWGACATSIIT
jgi:hypothetical protein